MLDAGVALMLAEWQPTGMRPQEIPRDTLEEFVFHFFGPLLAPRGFPPIDHVTAMIASAEESRLHVSRSSEAHRRLLAMRLDEIVRSRPLANPLIRRAPSAIVMKVTTDGDDTQPALDPHAACGRCGTLGTVARVTVASQPRRITRFCPTCWREVRSDYISRGPPRPPSTAREQIAFLDRPTEPVSVESRLWDDIEDNIDLVLSARADPEHRKDVTPQLLAQLADGIELQASKMHGPMTEKVTAFVKEFGHRQ
jgi:hypothetical protein